MAKVKLNLGVFVGPLDEETHKRLETYNGIRVRAVAEGSPAHLAGILPGDVILIMGKDDVRSVESFSKDLLPKYAGQTITIQLDRNGTDIEKVVHLNSSLQANYLEGKE